MMKKTYETPTFQVSVFETEEILFLSNSYGIVVAPPTGSSTEVGSGIEIGW